MNSPRIALIGCGAIAEAMYLPALAKVPGALDNTVLVDTNEARLAQLAAKFGAKHTATNYLECDVEGAIVATPHHLHHRISLDFLARGKHVLCEKPLTEQAHEARELCAQADASGVTLQVNLTRRLLPSYRKIKEMIDAGALGTLREIYYLDGEYFQWPTVSGFYFKKTSPAGVMLDRGAHGLDLICWWLGQAPEVVESQTDSFGGFEGTALLQLKCAACDIRVKLSWLQRMDNIFRIRGDKGTVQGKLNNWHNIDFIDPSGRTRGIRLNGESYEYTDFALKLVHNFIGVLRGSEQPLIPARSVLPSVELIEACYAHAARIDQPWYTAITQPHPEASGNAPASGAARPSAIRSALGAAGMNGGDPGRPSSPERRSAEVQAA